MQTWLKDNGSRLAVLAAVFTALFTAFHLFVVSPIHKRFDDLRTDMNQRFDDMNRSVNQRFDDMKRNVNQRFDDMERNVSQRFDAQDGRLDRLTEEVSELRQLTVGIVERVSRNEDRIQAVQEQLQTADAP